MPSRSAIGTTRIATPATHAHPPTSTPTTSLYAWSSASRVRSRSRWCASRCSTMAPPPRSGATSKTTRATASTRPTASPPFVCSATPTWASRAIAPIRATRWSRASSASALSPGRGSCGGQGPPSRPRRGSSAPATSGGPGWPKATIQTILGAPTCNVRRSPSRASPSCRPARSSRLPRHPCPRPPKAPATGTTATAGCATPPSRCGHCTRWGSTGRPTTSSSTSPTWSATRTGPCRSCTASRGKRTSAGPPSTTSRATRARARCGSATVPTTSARTTCTVRCSTRFTCTQSSAITSPSGLWPILID